MSDCSQTPFSLKKELSSDQGYFWVPQFHYLSVTSMRMLRGTVMTLSFFCLSSAAPSAHKSKSPPGRCSFDNPGGMCGWNQALRKSETQNVRGQLCSTSVVLGWVKQCYFFKLEPKASNKMRTSCCQINLLPASFITKGEPRPAHFILSSNYPLTWTLPLP